MDGWIKLHRQLKDHWINKDSEIFHLWINLLLSATHKNYQTVVNGKIVDLYPGQLLFGRKKWAQELKISESKIYRILKKLEEADMIIVYTTNKYSIITIKNWSTYQSYMDSKLSKNVEGEHQTEQQGEQQNEQQNKQQQSTENQQLHENYEQQNKQQNEHTDKQQTDTNKNIKNDKNKDVVVIDFTAAKSELINRCQQAFNGNVNSTKVTSLYDFINKGLSVDLIMAAINKGIMKTGNQIKAFDYAYSTLINWYNEGKKTLGDLSSKSSTKSSTNNEVNTQALKMSEKMQKRLERNRQKQGVS